MAAASEFSGTFELIMVRAKRSDEAGLLEDFGREVPCPPEPQVQLVGVARGGVAGSEAHFSKIRLVVVVKKEVHSNEAKR